MKTWVRGRFEQAYERYLRQQIGRSPAHVAVIQDGNRRYARKRGKNPTDGHHRGAETTEQLLQWCDEIGIEELTVYAFSTENFERPPEEREALFDLIESKLREFADATEVHDRKVRITAIGDLDKLPQRVQGAIRYADERTDQYDRLKLNVALAYGGRTQLLGAARSVVADVKAGALEPVDIDVTTIEDRLYDHPLQDVDLIIRTGGDERTSNFLPWHANGNEAAVFFCTPYWPEFRKIDFLRAVRTYEHREKSWQQTRARRALALIQAVGESELEDARTLLARINDANSSLATDSQFSEGSPLDDRLEDEQTAD